MADAAISVLLDQLVSNVRRQIDQEIKLVMGVENEVANLTRNLIAIQDVLEDAEKRQLRENNVRHWLYELKDLSYDMDNVLDQWSTALLQSEMAKKEKGSQSYVLSEKKVCLSLLFTCFGFTQSSQLGQRHDIALKIKTLNKKLDDIAITKNRYDFNVSKTIDELERPTTTSIVDVSKVHGRDRDKENVIRMLLSESSQEKRGRFVIPIVGMGGIGKTTLAKLAYNDDEVKNLFDKRVWVCVSDPFDVTKVAKAIVEQLTGQAPMLAELESLVQTIVELIRGQQFLLVLDDVWTDDYEKWENLKQALEFCAIGSRIIVTTRKKDVAFMMGGASQMIILEELSEEDCWLLFSEEAFLGRDKEEREELEETGWKIASKCRGLPLAAKTLGSLMRFKRTKEQWLQMLHSDMWNLEEAKRNLFIPLLLSYFDLSPTVKRCLSYCAVFPKDVLIARGDLVQQWLSQGYFGLKSDVEMEKTGVECFENLAMRSFFQDFEKDRIGNIIACKMHDITHDFVQFLTKYEYFLTEIKDSQESLESSRVIARHLTLKVPWHTSIPASILKGKDLRTLMVLDSNITAIGPDEFSHLKYLRTLNLSGCLIKELPDHIGELIYLRYLNLSYNHELKELPSSVCNLYNLQTLRLIDCTSLQKLPDTIGKLANLRHLYVSGCNMRRLPKGIGQLKCLQTIDVYPIVDNVHSKVFCQLGDLRNLNYLRSIQIKRLDFAKDVDEADQAQLKNKKYMIQLCFNFSSDTLRASGIKKTQKDVLEALQPHEDLVFLAIMNYFGGITVSPSWLMSLTNLRSLVLWRCLYCEVLPPLGKLPSLKSLEISNFGRLKKVGPEFMGIEVDTCSRDSNDPTMGSTRLESSDILFPKLQELAFKCTLLCEWVGIPGWRVESPQVLIMPRLRSLTFDLCHSLELLPDFLQAVPLQNLIIKDCPTLQDYCQSQTGKEWTKISHVPSIQIYSTEGGGEAFGVGSGSATE